MGRCPSSPKKKRHNRGRGHASPYKQGMRGHSYQRLLIKDVGHCGRICKGCGKKFLNMRGMKEDATGNNNNK